MRLELLAKSATGTAIAGLVACWFATAPVTVTVPGQESALARAMPAAQSSVTLAGMQSGDREETALLAQAVSARSFDLLWADTLSLSSRGEETATNVRLAAERIDLTVLHQNEIFSFNQVVGIRSEERGYLPGLMYSNGEVVTGIGGGICIVSTILYNAALETGLNIIERHPHSGPVSYAGPGLDAAVSFGWADLCFRNNTGGLLLIRTKAMEDKLIVALYGTKKAGRTVEIVTEGFEEIPYKIFEKEDETVPEGEPVVKQKARTGFVVTTVRLIRQNGRLVSREVISHDTVLPMHKIMLMPPKPEEPMEDTEALPGEPRLSPRPSAAPPVSGVIQVPDDADSSEPGSGSEGASRPDEPGRSLSTSERAVPSACE